MTTSTAEPEDRVADPPAPGGPAGLTAAGRATDPAAGERGRTEIADDVIRRIAEHAADRTEGTARARRRIAGIGLGEHGVVAHVRGRGGRLSLALEVPLTYPVAIEPAVERVRQAVREQVETLTGYRVRALDVTVTALVSRAGATAGADRRTVS